ncbi:MAG: glycine betaine ABC transporter substrate-binding protein [Phycisphaerales bacterium JB040]
MNRRTPRLAALLALLAAALCARAQAPDLTIGAKNFTEQEVLAELTAQLIERTTDLSVRRRQGLGGTDICHAALRAGDLDLYIEYTGTALLNVLKLPVTPNRNEAFLTVARAYRDSYDLEWLAPLGFNNTYAITVRERQADNNDWNTISDLADSAQSLRAGFTAEFAERPDGYPGLRDAYGLELASAVDLEPGLMYAAVNEGQVDVICAFATDARIDEYDLRTLDDDLGFFPPYDAAPVVRADTLDRYPELRDTLALLAGAISDDDMRELNHAVDVQRRAPADVAREWLDRRLPSTIDPESSAGRRATPRSALQLALHRRADIARKTLEHLVLTALGASIAIAIGIPLGILIHRKAPARGPVLAATEIVQTIPSLAMLAFLFAIYGLLGTAPAVTALVLYALLPIVLNTYTGLREVPAKLTEAADAVGLTPSQRLRLVELPLAAPVIIAGIRAATVLTVGIATLSTYIGAGGLGDFIARGLARNDTRLTLLGAVPAAGMAVALSLAIRLLEARAKRR